MKNSKKILLILIPLLIILSSCKEINEVNNKELNNKETSKVDAYDEDFKNDNIFDNKRFQLIEKEKIIKDIDGKKLFELKVFYDKETNFVYTQTTTSVKSSPLVNPPVLLINKDGTPKQFEEIKDNEFLFSMISREVLVESKNQEELDEKIQKDKENMLGGSLDDRVITVIKDNQNEMEYILLSYGYKLSSLTPLK